MNDYYSLPVSEELFASWLDGNLTDEENSYFMEQCAGNPSMSEILDVNDDIDATYQEMIENYYELPDNLLDDFVIPEIGYGNLQDFDDENSISDFGYKQVGNLTQVAQGDYPAGGSNDEKDSSEGSGDQLHHQKDDYNYHHNNHNDYNGYEEELNNALHHHENHGYHDGHSHKEDYTYEERQEYSGHDYASLTTLSEGDLISQERNGFEDNSFNYEHKEEGDSYQPEDTLADTDYTTHYEDQDAHNIEHAEENYSTDYDSLTNDSNSEFI